MEVNMRIQARKSNGQFTRNTLTNCFGISENDTNTTGKTYSCSNCGYECRPILKTWICQKCGTENRKALNS